MNIKKSQAEAESRICFSAVLTLLNKSFLFQLCWVVASPLMRPIEAAVSGCRLAGRVPVTCIHPPPVSAASEIQKAKEHNSEGERWAKAVVSI